MRTQNFGYVFAIDQAHTICRTCACIISCRSGEKPNALIDYSCKQWLCESKDQQLNNIFAHSLKDPK